MYAPDAEAAPAASPARPDLRVVAARRTPRRAIPRSWVATVVGLLVAVLCTYVHTVMQEADLNRKKTEIDALRDLTIKPRMQLEQARHPALIDRKAQGLGMQPPGVVVFLNKPLQVKPTPKNRIPLPLAVTHEGF